MSLQNERHTPRNMLRAASNPAAKILAVYGGFLSTRIRQANREIVLCVTLSRELRWHPGMVSITTKSIGPSEERPIWNMSVSSSCWYSTMIALLRERV